MKETGTLITWFENRRYGFIMPDAPGREIFVHLTDIVGRVAPPKNSRVSYDLAEFNGRPKCVNVEVLSTNGAGGAL